MKNDGLYLNGLNGIRTIAVFSVVLSHTLMAFDYFGFKSLVGWDFASYGVTMFFTLSGFLITFLLLKEKLKFNNINIKEFYIRRILRIWPLYYFFIIIAIIIILLYYHDILPGNIYYYLFIAGNIAITNGIVFPLIAHYWSLGVEEQFYLFWPWLIKLFNPLKSIIIFLFLFLFIKIILLKFSPLSFAYKFINYTRFDCMAIGSLFAIIINNNFKTLLAYFFKKTSQIISWLIWIFAATGKLSFIPFSHDILSVVTGIIILNLSFNNQSLINLENNLFRFIGKISYGIYIYHSIVLFFLVKIFKEQMIYLNNLFQFCFILILAATSSVFLASLSYKYFEQPFLKLKQKFSRIKSSA